MARDDFRDDFIYEGKLAATRTEPTHVTLPDGSIRSLAILRAVNFATDPQLREPVLTGAVHRFEGGEELAIPMIVHEPREHCIVIYLPESLRHLELDERARYAIALRDDTEQSVPRYAREPRVAIGLAALAAAIAPETNSRAADAARHAELDEREEQLVQRDARMRERAESLTRREDEILGSTDALTVRERELERRTKLLEEREATLREREKAVETSVALPAPFPLEGESPAPVRRGSLPPPPVAGPPREPAPAIALPAERPKSIPPPVRAEAEESHTERPPAPADDDDFEDAIELTTGTEHEALAKPPVDDDDDEEIEEIDESMAQPITGLHDVALRDPNGTTTVALEDVVEVREGAAIDGPAVPIADDEDDDDDAIATHVASADKLAEASRFLSAPSLRDDQAFALRQGDGVELLVREAKLERPIAEDTRRLELACQLAQGSYPFVILTVASDDGVVHLRAPISPVDDGARRALDTLRRRFEGHLVILGGASPRRVRLQAAREVNLQKILELADRVVKERGASLRPPTAAVIEDALTSTPLPSRSHPLSLLDAFEESAGDPAAVRSSMAVIADYLGAEKLEAALTVASVPRQTIDTMIARVIEAALVHGLALPPVLIDRAVATGIAADPADLTERLVKAFRAAHEGDRVALEAEAVASNWEKLLALAGDHELTLPSSTRLLAERSIRAVRGETTSADSAQDLERVAKGTVPELFLMLDDLRLRRAATLELISRGAPEHIDRIAKTIRKMPRADVVRVVPKLLSFGEDAGDALIDGLSARKTFVRQAFAAGIGQLKLRRAVVPLLHVLVAEPSDVWRELARVYGTFGASGFRPFVRQLADGKCSDERAAHTLAHLALHGSDEALTALVSDPEARAGDGRVAKLAERALGLRDEARAYEAAVAGTRPTPENDAVLQFARRFAQEVAGDAPEADLAPVGDDA